MTLYEVLKTKVREWRKSNYFSDFSAIGEVFEYNFLNANGQDLRYLRKVQFEALETYWYLRLIENTPHIFNLYKKYFQGEDLLNALNIRLDEGDLRKILFSNGGGIETIFKKIKGTLTGGKTSDIDFNEIKQILNEKNAINVSINRYSFYSKEFDEINVEYKDMNPYEIEESILRENSGNIDILADNLREEEGVKTAIQLLKILKQNQIPNEKKNDYYNRIYKDSLNILGIEGILDDI